MWYASGSPCVVRGSRLPSVGVCVRRLSELSSSSSLLPSSSSGCYEIVSPPPLQARSLRLEEFLLASVYSSTFRTRFLYCVVKNSILTAHTESSSVGKCEVLVVVLVGVVGEFWCDVLILLVILEHDQWSYLWLAFKKNLPVPAHTPTPPPPLTTVSELANNSPKRNLNTMNLGD